jgi:hypothetical protein
VLPHGPDTDPIVKASHKGEHCIFFQPGLPIGAIYYKQKLQDLCDWINSRLQEAGVDQFIQEPFNWYEIANLVKLNLWINDIRKQGIIKPFLIAYTGEDQYSINNGESRLRCLEVIPEIDSVDCFITTHQRYAEKFDHLPYIENFEQYAEICHANIGQEFQFRFTDKFAPYGLDWYETNSRKTGHTMLSQELCRELIQNYLRENPMVVFSPDWFSTTVDWTLYKKN